MALATYTDLLAAAANWLSRSDLTSRIPEFVTLAQARINRQVKIQVMETKNTSFSITGEYVNVPSDFLQVRHFYLTSTSTRRVLSGLDADGMTEYTSSGIPSYFQVVGSQFRFSPVPDATYTATLIYYAKPATLATTSQETNSLFPACADLFLYATLLEAEAFIQDDPRLGVWKSGYDEALASINRFSTNARYGDGSLATRPG
jgi:hypothetical protein